MTRTKGHSQKIDSFFQESTARQITKVLKEHGIRARYQRESRSINEEPYVEHTYDLIVDFVHKDELECAKRILKGHFTG